MEKDEVATGWCQVANNGCLAQEVVGECAKAAPRPSSKIHSSKLVFLIEAQFFNMHFASEN